MKPTIAKRAELQRLRQHATNALFTRDRKLLEIIIDDPRAGPLGKSGVGAPTRIRTQLYPVKHAASLGSSQ